MKNKINTKDEADNGGACCALPAGWGVPWRWEGLGGAGANEERAGMIHANPGPQEVLEGEQEQSEADRWARGPSWKEAQQRLGGDGGWGHGRGRRSNKFPVEPWTRLASGSSKASKPGMVSSMVGEDVGLCIPHRTQRVGAQQTAEGLRSEGTDTFLCCS